MYGIDPASLLLTLLCNFVFLFYIWHETTIKGTPESSLRDYNTKLATNKQIWTYC